MLQFDAFIRSSPHPSYLSTIDEAASGLSDSSAVDSSVIIPCSFMVTIKVLMHLVDKMHISVINCVLLLRFPWLFIWVLGPNLQYPPHLLPCYYCVFMSKSSSQDPLSLSSDSNGSGSNMQDPVSLGNSDAQPPNTIVLDRTRPHNSTQSINSPRTTFASTLKLEPGSHGSDLKSALDPNSGSQHGLLQSPGGIMKGESSNLAGQTPSSVSSCLSKSLTDSITEFSACYLLRQILGGEYSFGCYYPSY